MGEVRKDYLLDRWVIIASERGKRPHEFKQRQRDPAKTECVFCPGAEKNTPGEVLRIADGKTWKMRIVPNKFGAVQPSGNADIQTENTFFTFADNYGFAEVLIESPVHGTELADLSLDDLDTVLRLYQERITALSAKSGIRYVS